MRCGNFLRRRLLKADAASPPRSWSRADAGVYGPEYQGQPFGLATALSPDLDVRYVMLEVVPGPDGEGVEVYAQSVDDVLRKLSEMGQRIEELESRPSIPAPSTLAPQKGG